MEKRDTEGSSMEWLLPFTTAESEANCDAGEGPEDGPGRGAGGKGRTAAEPGG